MQLIQYTDNRLTRIGRWKDTGIGLWSAWGGSQIVFKVSGTQTLTVVANVICTTGQLCLCECVIDNSPENSLIGYFANKVNLSGERSVTFDLPDTNEHTIIIKTNGYRASLFPGKTRSVIKNIGIADTAVLSEWKQGVKMIQCVGDSWMAADADWPRMMPRDLWSFYQIATGGMTVVNMNAEYNFQSAGVAAEDPEADVVIIGYGVNDYNQSVSISTFQAHLLALIDKVRAKQPDAPIFLIQIPRNLNTGAQFDRYGGAMQNVASYRPNVFYISTQPIWSQVTWNADRFHLSAGGKIVMADFVSDRIQRTLGYKLPIVRLPGGVIIDASTVITDAYPIRYRGSVDLGLKLDNLNEEQLAVLRVGSAGRTYEVVS
jgi:lysophospholipase L1-like esterase